MPERRVPLAWFDRSMADLAGIGLVLMMMMTVGSSLSRFVFGTPLPDVEAIAEMLLVGVVFFGFAYAQALGQHVQVTLFTEPLSAKAKRRLAVFGYVIGIMGFSVLLYALFNGAMTAWRTGDAYLGVNLIRTWPARTLAVIGVAAMVLRLILDLAYFLFSDPNSPEHTPVDEEASGDTSRG
jgi:TRAP-type C4-dicarboxylate transport system permease small subunit